MNWRTVALRYPLAAQAFNGWVSNKASLRGYQKYIRPGIPASELPWEMQQGIVQAFLEEQGYLLEPVYSAAGYMKIRLYEKRESGFYRVFKRNQNDDPDGPVQHSIVWQRAFLSCFRRLNEQAQQALEPVAEKQDETTEFIGVSLKDLSSEDVS